MATNAPLNVFNNQTLFAESVAFAWKADTTLLDLIPFDSSLNDRLGASNHAGSTVNARRPSWIKTNVANSTPVQGQGPNAGTTGDFYDDSLANGVFGPGSGTSNVRPGTRPLQQVTVPVSITHEITADIEVSAQRLTQSLTKEQMQREFIEPLLAQAKEQISVAVCQDMFLAQGNTVLVPSALAGAGTATPSYAQLLTYALGNAGSLMRKRLGTNMNSKKVAVFHPDVAPLFGAGLSNNFHMGASPESIQSSGKMGSLIQGFLPESSAITPNITAQAHPNTAGTATALSVTASTMPNYWVPTWTVTVAGWGANTPILPNQRIYFSTAAAGADVAMNGGTVFTATGPTINWVRTTTGQDTGSAATFVIVSASGTANQAVNAADAAGSAVLTLSGPAIPFATAGGVSNDQVNINLANAAALVGKYVFLVGSNKSAAITYKPTIAFDPTAVTGVSQAWDVPIGTPWFRRYNIGGFKFTVLADRVPGGNTTVMSLRGLFGLGVTREEGITTILGS